MEKVTADGVITIEENKTTAETYTEVVEGMQFDRGYVTPYMVTDTEKMETVYEDCSVLITDKKISVFQDIVPLLESVIQSGRKLLIIAEDVEGDALSDTPLFSTYNYSVGIGAIICLQLRSFCVYPIK